MSFGEAMGCRGTGMGASKIPDKKKSPQMARRDQVFMT